MSRGAASASAGQAMPGEVGVGATEVPCEQAIPVVAQATAKIAFRSFMRSVF